MHHPFLHGEVIGAAQRIPTEEHIVDGRRKAILCQVAELMGLRDVAQRPKKAAQYGSGIMKVIKKEAKRRGMSSQQLVHTLAGEES